MTLDMIFMLLADFKVLRARMKSKDGGRTVEVPSAEAGAQLTPDADGMVKGRAKDGTPIKGRIRGKSLARELMERQQAREAKEARAALKTPLETDRQCRARKREERRQRRAQRS